MAAEIAEITEITESNQVELLRMILRLLLKIDAELEPMRPLLAQYQRSPAATALAVRKVARRAGRTTD